MSRYDRHYDYGLRGARQTGGPRYGAAYEGRYGGAYRGEGPRMSNPYDERGIPRVGNRVTARYNADYVYGARGLSGYDHRNYMMYTGDRPDRMGDERYYRRPYMTRAGTRTLRGSSFPTGYDAPDYGPNYGGRYPDELY